MAAGAARNRIFISCVSDEFLSLRESLRRYLSRADCDVKVQEDFCQTPEDTIEKIDGYIKTCAAVVHILGRGTGKPAHAAAVRRYLPCFDDPKPFLGCWPELRAALGDFSGMSYTQWEAFVALHHGIPLFVYQADGAHWTYAATDADKASQQRHIGRLRLGRRHTESFTGEHDLFGKLIGDLRKILPATAGHQPFNLPGSIGPLFKGREDFLAKLRETLEAATEDAGANGAQAAARGVAAISAPRAIHGLGGVGKTRTAVEFGHRFRHEYSALLLVRADTAHDLRRNLADLCGPLVLDLPAVAAPEQDVRLAAALHWLEEHPRWFLILDNVDNEEAAREVESLIGNMRGGHIVITTRLSNGSGQVEALDLNVLDEDAAVDFLTLRTAGRRPAAATDAADVRTLARELDNLALALEQAGAYVCEKRMSFAAYLRRWQGERSAVLGWFNGRTMRYPASVAVTWATTFEQLTPPARALLEMLAFLGAAPIPRALLETEEAPGILALAQLGPDARELPAGEAPSACAMEDALAELANYSLVRCLEEPPASFSIHRLVQEIMRMRLDEAARTARWTQTVRLVDAYSPERRQDISTWPRWTELAPHLGAMFKKAREQGDPEPIPGLLMGFAGFLVERNASFSAAEPLLRRALEARERMLGPEHRRTLASVRGLADLLHAKGDYDGAEPLYRRALDASERMLGTDHPNTLATVNNLAGLLAQKGDYDGAEPYFLRALEVRERVLGPEHRDTLGGVNNLAVLLQRKGDYGRAEALCRRALEARERMFGPEHPDTLQSVNTLAVLLKQNGDYDRAEALCRRALEARDRVLGPEHPATLASVNNLAELLKVKGDYGQAEALCRRALEARERVLGPEHPATLENVNALAELLEEKGDYGGAEPLCRQALEAHARVLGSEHPATLESVCNLANLLKVKGDHGGAEPLYRRALGAFERMLGADHPSTLATVSSLAGLLHAKGDYATAEPLCRRAMEGFERVMGPEHPVTLTSVYNLAGLLFFKGDYADAEPLFHRVAEGNEHILGAEHPSTRIARENWELCLGRLKK